MKRINTNNDKAFTIFESPYRPFFILAAISSLFYMTIWTLFYSFKLPLNFENISPTMWHAHEMLFGYTMAVIAGFLLTVEKYWLGKNIDSKSILLTLVILWIAARVSIFLTLITNIPYEIGAILDCLFMIVLTIRVTYPIISARAWDKMGLVAHIAIVAAANVVFYLGLSGIISNGQYLGVYSALYLIISIILLMGRRMIPIFIRNGLEFKFEPKNWRVIDILSLVFFVLFFIYDLFFTSPITVSIISGILAIIYSIRLFGWYSNKIWSKPLLWVLFVAYSWIAVGFTLKFLSLYFNIFGFLSLHSFTYGGIGIITIGFMSRVILGHTGRNVFEPPKILFWIFSILFAGAIVRVFFPLIDISLYQSWIGVSQLLWILSFLIFAVVYLPMLFRPSIEKKL
ncbi:MAG: NnrS family protein [Thermodesulfobacteriales bacterium]